MHKILMLVAALLFGWAEVALGSKVNANPLEQLFAPWFKGPSFVDIASSDTTFAGRTTLASGSTSVVVSTSNVKSNSIIIPHVEVALAAAYTTRGQFTLASGDTSGVASTTAIYSGMNILLMMQSTTSQLSGFPRGVRVNSIVDGVSFQVIAVDSLQVQGTQVIGWTIPEAVPQGLKVNTITESGYFTLGWADGRARPVDVTVMWEVKLPGRTVA